MKYLKLLWIIPAIAGILTGVFGFFVLFAPAEIILDKMIIAKTPLGIFCFIAGVFTFTVSFIRGITHDVEE